MRKCHLRNIFLRLYTNNVFNLLKISKWNSEKVKFNLNLKRSKEIIKSRYLIALQRILLRFVFWKYYMCMQNIWRAAFGSKNIELMQSVFLRQRQRKRLVITGVIRVDVFKAAMLHKTHYARATFSFCLC